MANNKDYSDTTKRTDERKVDGLLEYAQEQFQKGYSTAAQASVYQALIISNKLDDDYRIISSNILLCKISYDLMEYSTANECCIVVHNILKIPLTYNDISDTFFKANCINHMKALVARGDTKDNYTSINRSLRTRLADSKKSNIPLLLRGTLICSGRYGNIIDDQICKIINWLNNLVPLPFVIP